MKGNQESAGERKEMEGRKGKVKGMGKVMGKGVRGQGTGGNGAGLIERKRAR